MTTTQTIPNAQTTSPALSVHGRFPGGFAWFAHPDELAERSSTAFAEGGRVWLIDPLRADGLDAEVATLGKVTGVIITFVGHDRDVAWLANYYDVPVYFPRHIGRLRLNARVEQVEGRVPDSPLQLLPSVGRGLLAWFRDTAVWWPEQGAMAIGDAVNSAAYTVQPGERLAVHPWRRFSPPTELLTIRPQRIYSGHGPSVTEGAALALEQAVRTAYAGRWGAQRHSLATVLSHLRRRGAS